jgi:uncharacterized membrane protein
MTEKIAELLTGIPPHWVTLIIGSLPIAELRGAIPWALAFGKMNLTQAVIWSLLGNAIPIIPVLLLLEPVSNILRRMKIFDRFFNWLFIHTRKKSEKAIMKYKALGLAVFVGIPLPGTGVWTGAVAAFVFGIPFKVAFPAILLGMLMAGALVTMTCMGVIGFLKVIM